MPKVYESLSKAYHHTNYNQIRPAIRKIDRCRYKRKYLLVKPQLVKRTWKYYLCCWLSHEEKHNIYRYNHTLECYIKQTQPSEIQNRSDRLSSRFFWLLISWTTTYEMWFLLVSKVNFKRKSKVKIQFCHVTKNHDCFRENDCFLCYVKDGGHSNPTLYLCH